jgi:hypothetical protein
MGWVSCGARLSQRLEAPIEILREALDEHEGAHLLRCAGHIAALVQARGQLGQHLAPAVQHLVLQRLYGRCVGGLVERLAPGHLLHQEARGHGGVAFGLDGTAAQLAEVGRTPERILESGVSLVDAHRPLQGQALRGGAHGGKAVGVHLGLQGLPARVDLGAVLGAAARQAEQFEVVAVELHQGRGASTKGRETEGRGNQKGAAWPRPRDAARSVRSGRIRRNRSGRARSGC